MSETKKTAVITLLDDSGKSHEFTLRALEDQQYDTIDAWLRSEYMKAVRASIREDPSVTSQEYEFEIKAAQSVATGLTLLSGEGARQMSTPKGLAKLIYEHCQEIDISLDELRSMMFNLENVEQVNNALMELNLEDEDIEGLLKEQKDKEDTDKARKKHLRRNKRKKRGRKRKG